MSETLISPPYQPALPCLAFPAAPEQLWTVVYRSRPRPGLDERVLPDLLRQARTNNQAAGISGVLVVADDEIVQWLEGPEIAVRELMAKISADPRHTDVSVMESFPVHKRLFSNWAMLLASEDPLQSTRINQRLQVNSPAIVSLESNPGALRGVFARLADTARSEAIADVVPITADPNMLRPHAAKTTEELIDNLLASPFLPAVAERASRNGQERPLLISALTRVALGHDLNSLETVLRRGSSRSRDPLAAQILMLEQTERRLGDMWETDDCSEADISLALLEMVSAMRSIHLGARPKILSASKPPSVLVISEPGEFHLLPAVLDAEVLFQRGWQPQLDFPASDKALVTRLGSNWFEAVDISLSDVFRREHWLQRLTETIATIRKHSRNRHVAITVSGRVFRDHQDLLAGTGADRLVLSASEIEWSITEAMRSQESSSKRV